MDDFSITWFSTSLRAEAEAPPPSAIRSTALHAVVRDRTDPSVLATKVQQESIRVHHMSHDDLYSNLFTIFNHSLSYFAICKCFKPVVLGGTSQGVVKEMDRIGSKPHSPPRPPRGTRSRQRAWSAPRYAAALLTSEKLLSDMCRRVLG